MKRASNKPADGTRIPSGLQPGRLTPPEIESLRKEFQRDGAWAQAELEGLEQEEAKRPKHKQNYKSRKPTKSPT